MNRLRMTIYGLTAALAACVVLAGCTGSSAPADQTSQKAAPGSQTNASNAAPAQTSQSTTPSSQTTQNADSAKQSSSADATYSTNCSGCHGSMTQGGGYAPNLSHEGANPKHTVAWLVTQIEDPSAHGSHMPAFKGRIPDADIKALAEKLASLK